MLVHVSDAHCGTSSLSLFLSLKHTHMHTHIQTVLTTRALKENEHTSALIMLLRGTKGWFVNVCF